MASFQGGPAQFGRETPRRQAAAARCNARLRCVYRMKRPRSRAIATGPAPWHSQSAEDFMIRVHSTAIRVLTIGFLAAAAPALADSVAVTSGPDGTVVTNGKPCRVVTTRQGGPNTGSTNSTTITAGPGGVSGSTTISPGAGNNSSVTVGSGSSSNGTQSSSAAGGDCVIYRNE